MRTIFHISKLTCILMVFLSSFCESQEIQEISPLYFGTVVVLDNSTPGSINIDALGNVTISTHFAVVDQPMHGEFQLVGYAPNATVFLTGGIVQAGTTSPQVSPEQFTLNAVNVRTTVNIESDGTAEFRVGGELITSGSGSLTFGNQEYTARLSITVNY